MLSPKPQHCSYNYLTFYFESVWACSFFELFIFVNVQRSPLTDLVGLVQLQLLKRTLTYHFYVRWIFLWCVYLWEANLEVLKQQFVIRGLFSLPDKRYIRIRNLSTSNSNYIIFQVSNSLTNSGYINKPNQRCASKSPWCSKALTLSGPLFVNRKNRQRPKK